ncbi:MAG: hypothetical protein QW731_00665, partial [Thermofilaceae archaeon]
EFNDTLALSYEPVMQWYFRATLVEVKDYLRAVWKALLANYFSGKLSESEYQKYVDAITAPLNFTDPLTSENVTFTQDYAISICEKFQSDAAFKDVLITMWKRAAIDRYSTVLKSLGG